MAAGAAVALVSAWSVWPLLLGGPATVGIRVATVNGEALVAGVDLELQAVDRTPQVGVQVVSIDGQSVSGWSAVEVQDALEGRRRSKVSIGFKDSDDRTWEKRFSRRVQPGDLPNLPAVVFSQDVNLRSGPGTNREIFQVATADQCFLVWPGSVGEEWLLLLSPKLYSAQGFAVASLTRGVEECSSPEMITISQHDITLLDNSMAALYSSLRESLAPPDSEQLLQDQRAWLNDREDRCGVLLSVSVADAPPRSRACLWEMIAERGILLDEMTKGVR